MKARSPTTGCYQQASSRPGPLALSHPAPDHRPHRLPASIWALGFVSLFMDASSELVHALLPALMATTLGASMLSIGLVEGIAEATASVTKAFSGTLSDRFRKRKLLVVLGYGLSALTKPAFPLASTLGQVTAARFVDRVGKGIRGAPRDALVADITPAGLRGAAYGLRQALDSVGAILGPLLAVAFMALLADDVQAVLWVAAIPAALAVLVLVVAVREPPIAPAPTPGKALVLADARRLPRRYWRIVLLGAVFTLARFSEAFLILRAQDLGLALGLVPVILIVMNLVYALGAWPAGAAADRLSPRLLLGLGLLALVLADLVLAAAASPAIALLGSALWGLHMALSQGLLSKLVADAAPAELRGTAFGLFHLVSGGALLLASALAGGLWTTFGAPVPFIAGAGFAGLAAAGLVLEGRGSAGAGRRA